MLFVGVAVGGGSFLWCAATLLRLLMLHQSDVRAEQGRALPPEEDSDEEEADTFAAVNTRSAVVSGKATS